MTTIAIIRNEKEAVIVADSQISFGDIKMKCSEQVNYSKIFSLGSNHFASTGAVAAEKPFERFLKQKDNSNDLELSNQEAIFDFFCEYLNFIKDGCHFKNENNQTGYDEIDACYLLINPHGIFMIHNWREVYELDKFMAVGSGDSFAMGAMAALYSDGKDILKTALKAVEIASEFDKGTGLPLHFVTVKLV